MLESTQSFPSFGATVGSASADYDTPFPTTQPGTSIPSPCSPAMVQRPSFCLIYIVWNLTSSRRWRMQNFFSPMVVKVELQKVRARLR